MLPSEPGASTLANITPEQQRQQHQRQQQEQQPDTQAVQHSTSSTFQPQPLVSDTIMTGTNGPLAAQSQQPGEHPAPPLGHSQMSMPPSIQHTMPTSMPHGMQPSMHHSTMHHVTPQNPTGDVPWLPEMGITPEIWQQLPLQERQKVYGKELPPRSYTNMIVATLWLGFSRFVGFLTAGLRCFS